MKRLDEFQPMTDAGNSERFVARHGALVRYTEDRLEWRAWILPVWRRGDMGPVYRHALETARSIAAEAEQVSDQLNRHPITGRPAPSDAMKLQAHAVKSESRGAQEAMIALAAHMPPVSSYASEFDADPWVLNTPNGIVDLRNDGAVKPCVPEAMQTRVTRAEFHPMADSPEWSAFLETITCGDNELRDWLQRAIGMTLIGAQLDHIFLFCFGGGANGKGTFLNAILHALGDYGMTLPPNLLIEKKAENHPTELADLEGRRMAVGSEVPKSMAWDEVRIKELTGGDRIRARRMRQDFVEFAPSHTFWVSGNDKPRIKGTDNGIWRRMRLVPFAANVAPEDIDTDLPARLAQQSPAILAWAVDGCRMYLSQGLGWCAAVKDATEAYQRDEDIFGAFLDDCCILDGNARCFKTLFRETLTKWLLDREYRPMSDRALKSELARRGVIDVRPDKSKGWEWVGVNLLSHSSIGYGVHDGR